MLVNRALVFVALHKFHVGTASITHPDKRITENRISELVVRLLRDRRMENAGILMEFTESKDSPRKTPPRDINLHTIAELAIMFGRQLPSKNEQLPTPRIQLLPDKHSPHESCSQCCHESRAIEDSCHTKNYSRA
ncbi:unnamed protein product [Phyllotreta striolata]|uniref:Uncharacterized protein n=1 Tax=Phyllotreta striolata TaxID=444603 RepID=A0A9N9TUN2_PHYSR|nr:unnamed protein product [Phyllotreta striolata]